MGISDERIISEYERVFIGLGSNIEPRLDYLKAAVHGLRTIGEIVHVSSVYETMPVGDIPQPHFLNAVAEMHTTLGPLELFTQLKALEKSVGRKERPRWHEREIDLDLLFYGDLVLESPNLTLPHPELSRRAFVLVPMNALDPNFIHPIWKKSISELLRAVDTSGVRATTLTL
jgi:2-amino-4-hydroxy-6-hydroxymethyldihydropteridine diphosphokinase